MPNLKITQLTELTTPAAADDLLAIVDVSENPDLTKKISIANVRSVEIENFTSNDVLTAAESGKLCTNDGAGGAIELTLPSAAAGLTFSFVVDVAQYLRINFATGDNGRYLATTSATAGYFRSNVAGNTITMVAIDATTWQVVSLDGSWSVDA